jgi:hypothetical protein
MWVEIGVHFSLFPKIPNWKLSPFSLYILALFAIFARFAANFSPISLFISDWVKF